MEDEDDSDSHYLPTDDIGYNSSSGSNESDEIRGNDTSELQRSTSAPEAIKSSKRKRNDDTRKQNMRKKLRQPVWCWVHSLWKDYNMLLVAWKLPIAVVEGLSSHFNDEDPQYVSENDWQCNKAFLCPDNSEKRRWKNTTGSSC